MTVLNTNTAALNAQFNLKKVQNNMEDAMAALQRAAHMAGVEDRPKMTLKTKTKKKKAKDFKVDLD